MLSVQPRTLTDDELERLTYMNAGALPAEWAEALRKTFAREFEEPQRVDDPRQLNLFDTK
jgi:hypothetical protein